jgi:putative transposase
MPEPAISWPHAPTHRLSERGTYFVTAGTYSKAHHFRTPQRLEVLHRSLLAVTRDFCWELEAWAVFSNHYRFVAHSQGDSRSASSLSQMLGVLHTQTAGWINRLDKTPGRKVWHNFWDTRLTYQKSYLARLNYVHQNAVKHGLVPVANQYGWSAGWKRCALATTSRRLSNSRLLKSGGAPPHSKTQASRALDCTGKRPAFAAASRPITY